MMVIGIDAHKRSHTAVMVDENGRERSTKTVGTTTQDHLRLLKSAALLDDTRLWAIEDCRHLTRRLERDLIAAGESVVRVPPKLMAHVRDSARTFGKSDPIDALAVARAALREPGLPVARLDGMERELRCWSITVRILSPNVPASSDDCAGICTSLILAGHHQQNWSAPALLTSCRSTCRPVATTQWFAGWRCDWWNTSAC
jgi:transposase